MTLGGWVSGKINRAGFEFGEDDLDEVARRAGDLVVDLRERARDLGLCRPLRVRLVQWTTEPRSSSWRSRPEVRKSTQV